MYADLSTVSEIMMRECFRFVLLRGRESIWGTIVEEKTMTATAALLTTNASSVAG
ncbi:MAG: hypothetical protein JO139_10650 [Alphaproteobacteria bacterium]|nr:hypothetical protein [Alphaproteobacteria bacterium]